MEAKPGYTSPSHIDRFKWFLIYFHTEVLQATSWTNPSAENAAKKQGNQKNERKTKKASSDNSL